MTTTDAAHAQPPAEADDDATLQRRAAAGDTGAFEALMRRYNRRLFRLARATLRNDADAEDALQDAYIAAYRGLARFRGEAALATWLSRLVLNQCYDRLRRQARRDNVVPIGGATPENERGIMNTPTDPSDAPDQALDRAEMRALIERKLDELPEAFRTVFVLRCVEELSVEETAQYLGVPEATVRTRHFRARSLLREALAREMDLAERDVFSFDGARCDRIVARVLSRLHAPDSE